MNSLFFTLSLTAATAVTTVTTAVLADPRACEASLPPIAPFFAEATRFAERLSPDGGWVGYLGPDEDEEVALWTVPADRADEPTRISRRGHTVSVFFWFADGTLVWQTCGLDGRAEFFRGQPGGGGCEAIPMPARGALSLAGVVPSGPDAGLLVTLSETATAWPDVFRVRLAGNREPERIMENRHRVSMWVTDGRGIPVAGLRWTPQGAKELVDLRHPQGRVALRTAPGDDLRLVGVAPDGASIRVITNFETDLTRLAAVSLTSGRMETLAADPLNKVDVFQFVTSADAAEILGVGYCDQRHRWQPLDNDLAAVIALVSAQPGEGDVTSAQVSNDRRRWLVTRGGDREPGTVWLCEPELSRCRQLWQVAPDLCRDELCPTQALTYPARDGTAIPALLTTPRHGRPPWPLVVFPHGGPHMRTFPGFDGRTQFLASRGYAVLQPNFRGSRGYGKAFMNAGDGQWGTGVMQTDLADGAVAMIQQGVAAKGRIAILGGSYGGYAALAGLAFTPEVYDAGVCLFGMSDLVRYVASPPAEWEPYAGDLVHRMGDPATEAGRADLAARSPVNHAAAIRAPLLLYHGLRDPLIAPAHASDMLAAMRRANKRCVALAAANEGHGFGQPAAEMAVYRAIEVFLHENLGGKTGPEPDAPVARRLAELHATAAKTWP